jgi:hypothetical protein
VGQVTERHPPRLDEQGNVVLTLETYREIEADLARQGIPPPGTPRPAVTDPRAWPDVRRAVEALEVRWELAEASELDAFLAAPVPDYDFLIPGLLERTDRVILTGPEGRGKSTLLRQLTVQAGAGIHPFTLELIEPVRCLYVDLENSRAQVRRALRPLRLAAADRYTGAGVGVVVEPAGMDLYGHAPDADWLAKRIEATEAQLLVIGPLYKLATGDPTSEEVARKVTAALDQLRAHYHIALLIEAHSPYASGSGRRPLRPYGASLWSRWPEFGLHLGETGTLTHWRGARDERDWPVTLKRGGEWPWTAVDNPREALWQRVLDYVDRHGRTAGITVLARELDASHGAVQRALAAHRDLWAALKAKDPQDPHP